MTSIKHVTANIGEFVQQISKVVIDRMYQNVMRFDVAFHAMPRYGVRRHGVTWHDTKHGFTHSASRLM